METQLYRAPGPPGAGRFPMSDKAQRAGVILLTSDLQKVIVVQGTGENSKWGFPKGAVEPGEAIGQTAEREVREETGVIFERRITDDTPRIVMTNHGKPLTFFVLISDSFRTATLRPESPEEIAEVRRIPVSELPREDTDGRSHHISQDPIQNRSGHSPQRPSREGPGGTKFAGYMPEATERFLQKIENGEIFCRAPVHQAGDMSSDIVSHSESPRLAPSSTDIRRTNRVPFMERYRGWNTKYQQKW